jgi:GNAT superfamily N-acetyltransferase
MLRTAVKRLLRIQDASALKQLGARAGLPAFDPANLERHAPDAHWVLLDDDGAIAGRFSLWWQVVPQHANDRLGIIGHYAADNAEFGRQLLTQACDDLKANRCTLAIGPMDGHTWRNYRFVTESNGAPPFFLEPSNPPEWPQQFSKHNFKPFANYYSSVDERLDADDDDQSHRAGARLAKLGINLRTLRMDRFDEERRTIHRVVTASFRSSFLYQPQSEAEFVAQYEPIRACVRPELVTIAMHADRAVGFIFTLPDMLQARAGKPVDTSIIKTLAILPERQFAGLGSHLVAANRRAARALGHRRLIHALMHESNKSRSISARYASVFRRYTLFAKPL